MLHYVHSSLPDILKLVLLLFYFYLFIYFGVSRQSFCVCSPGCPGTHSVDQAGLENGDPSASVS